MTNQTKQPAITIYTDGSVDFHTRVTVGALLNIIERLRGAAMEVPIQIGPPPPQMDASEQP